MHHFFEKYKTQIVDTSSEDYEFKDGEDVLGLFILKSSRESVHDSRKQVKTSGIFVTNSSTNINRHTILKRISDNTLFKVNGHSIDAPEIATIQIKRYPCELYYENRSE